MKSKELKTLQRRCSALQRQIKKLTESGQLLQEQLQLLDALCASFFALIAIHDSLFDIGLDLQTELQQQLFNLVCTGGAAGAATPARNDQLTSEDVQRIAPRTDQLALFKRIAVLPPVHDVGMISTTEVANMLRSAVMESAVKLHLLELGLLSHEQFHDRMEKLHQRYMHTLLCAVLAGKTDAAATLPLINLNTMQQDPESAMRMADRISQIVPLLGVTQLQLHDIAVGVAVFDSVLQGIVIQQKQLASTQKTSAQAGDDPDISRRTGHAGAGETSKRNGSSSTLEENGGNPGGSSSMQGATCIKSLDKDLDARSKHTARMQVLLRKEYTIRATACCWVLGCLSWEQVVRANILYWPHPLPLLVFAQEIARSHTQQRQQQRRPQGQGQQPQPGQQPQGQQEEVMQEER